MTILFYLIALGIVSLAAIIPLVVSRKHHATMITYSYWLLLVAVGSGLYQLFHLLEEAHEAGFPAVPYAGWFFLGLVVFGAIDMLVHHTFHGANDDCHCEDCDTKSFNPRALPYIFPNFIHALMDGTIIVGGFLASPAAGFTAALLILAHEAPKQAGGFGHLVQVAKLSPSEAVRTSLAVTLAGITLPMLVSLALGSVRIPEIALPIVAGGFASLVLRQLYASISHRDQRPLWIIPAGILISFAVVYGIMVVLSALLGTH